MNASSLIETGSPSRGKGSGGGKRRQRSTPVKGKLYADLETAQAGHRSSPSCSVAVGSNAPRLQSSPSPSRPSSSVSRVEVICPGYQYLLAMVPSTRWTPYLALVTRAIHCAATYGTSTLAKILFEEVPVPSPLTKGQTRSELSQKKQRANLLL